jgi:hypothetical protein
MKKAAIFLLVFICIAPLVYTVDLSIKFSTGLDFINPVNVNRLLQDWFTWHELEADAHINSHLLSGEAQELRSMIDLEGEFLLSLSENFALSIGSGLIFGEISQPSTETSVQKTVGIFTYVHPVQVSATPLILSGYAFLRLWRSFSIYAKGGTGILWTKYIDRDGRLRSGNIKYFYENVNKVTARSPIYQAGLGFIFEIEPGVRFFLEGIFRKAKVKGFSGENKIGETGKLYHYEKYSSNLGFWETQFAVLPEAPSGNTIRSVSEAVLDLSSFSVKIGLIVRF